MEGQLLLDEAAKLPGWMSLGELSFLAEFSKGLVDDSIIYEVGSFYGRSSRVIADNSPKKSKVYCIDPWNTMIPAIDGSVVVDEVIYQKFCSNLHDHIQSGKLIPIKMRWEDFTPDKKANFIFIDGDHSYDSAKHDISKALEYADPNNSIIVGHDYDWDDVHKAVNESFGAINVHMNETIWWTRIAGTPSQKEKLMEKKILVGLSTGEQIRESSFIPYFMGLQRPPNSFTTTVHGQSPAQSRNMIIKQGLDNGCTHIFFMDDDMIFPPDTLMKLLVHDKDIVSALYLLRSFPHRPAFFDKAYDNGRCKFSFLERGVNGLIKGVNCGLGAVLISTEVFKHLEQPYVRLGEIEKDGWCDDVGFFNRCREAGFDIYCDLNAPVGHMACVTLWPEMHKDEWFTNYKHPTGNVLIPQHIPTEEEMKDQELKLGK